MGQRIFAGGWLLLALWMAWASRTVEAVQPLGPLSLLSPSLWPMLVACLMALASLYLLLAAPARSVWPQPRTLLRVVLLALVLLLYMLALQWLGYALATALMTVVVGRLLGGEWIPCLIAGLAIGVGSYLFFDQLLDVVLPLGSVMQGGGEHEQLISFGAGL